MNELSLWKTFEKTGKIDDYLRYRQAENTALPAQPKEGGDRGAQNRRTDPAGK